MIFHSDINVDAAATVATTTFMVEKAVAAAASAAAPAAASVSERKITSNFDSIDRPAEDVYQERRYPG